MTQHPEGKRCGVQTLGDIFAMIAVATGAADKVIELMFRSPRMPPDGTLVLPSIQVWFIYQAFGLWDVGVRLLLLLCLLHLSLLPSMSDWLLGTADALGCCMGGFPYLRPAAVLCSASRPVLLLTPLYAAQVRCERSQTLPGPSGVLAVPGISWGFPTAMYSIHDAWCMAGTPGVFGGGLLLPGPARHAGPAPPELPGQPWRGENAVERVQPSRCGPQAQHHRHVIHAHGVKVRLSPHLVFLAQLHAGDRQPVMPH